MNATAEIASTTFRVAEAVTGKVDARPAPSPAEAAFLADVFRLVGNSMRELRSSLQASLGAGIEARALGERIADQPALARYVETRYRELLAATTRPHGDAVREAMEMTLSEISLLREVLDQAEALASAPRPPFDPERARAAEEAFERGETIPFRKGLLTGR
jgi:hypothetical protein